MIAILMDRIFEPAEETTLALVSLFEICADGRHALLTQPSWKKSGRMIRWLEALPRRMRHEAEIVLARSIQANTQLPAGTPRVRVDDVKACAWDQGVPVLDVKTALRLLRTPLRILVENRFNDSAFLRKMLHPSKQRELADALEKGWVEIEQGGGISEIKKRVEEVARDPIARSRLWVMFDSDANFDPTPTKQVEPSEVSDKLKDKCEEIKSPWSLRYHRLERRSIENYIPLKSLEGAGHKLDQLRRDPAGREFHRQQMRSLRTLGDKRHWYNMKSGLVGDVRDEKKWRYKNSEVSIDDNVLPTLFRGLSHDDKEALRKGFGDKVADLFQDKDGVEFVQELDLQAEITTGERDKLTSSLFERM